MRRKVLMSPLGVPCNPPPWGELSTVDLATGEIRWRVPLGQVKKGWFYMATPMTYSSGGRQFVVIAAGGHGALGGFGDSLIAFALPGSP